MTGLCTSQIISLWVKETGWTLFLQRPNGSLFSRSLVWNFLSWFSSPAVVLRSLPGAMPHAEVRHIATAVRASFCSQGH
jgi:hypothetical protein